MASLPRENEFCKACGAECSWHTHEMYVGLCAACWRSQPAAACSCDPRTPGVACESCWASHVADYDEWGSIFPPAGADHHADEPPELPLGHDFDPAELEDYVPTAADLAYVEVNRLGTALRDLAPEAIFEALAGLDGDRLVILEAVIQEALGLRADAANGRYATT